MSINYITALFNAANNAVMTGNNQLLADGLLTQGQAKINNEVVDHWTTTLPNGMKLPHSYGGKSMTVSQFASLFAKDMGDASQWRKFLQNHMSNTPQDLALYNLLLEAHLTVGQSFTVQQEKSAISKYLGGLSVQGQRQEMESACKDLGAEGFASTVHVSLTQATLSEIALEVAKSPNNQTWAGLYKEAQTGEQAAVQAAGGGLKAAQAQDTKDTNAVQQETTIVQPLLTLLQQFAQGIS